MTTAAKAPIGVMENEPDEEQASLIMKVGVAILSAILAALLMHDLAARFWR